MRNKVQEGRDFLEAKQPGLYSQFVSEAFRRGGVVHLSPDCLLLGYPCGDEPRTLYVLFQCSHLGSLGRLLAAISGRYDRVRWARQWKHDYGVREREIKDFTRHLGLGDAVSRG